MDTPELVVLKVESSDRRMTTTYEIKYKDVTARREVPSYEVGYLRGFGKTDFERVVKRQLVDMIGRELVRPLAKALGVE